MRMRGSRYSPRATAAAAWGSRHSRLFRSNGGLSLGGLGVALLVAGALVALALMLWSGEEARVKELIEEGIRAFEAEDVEGCVASLDEECVLESTRERYRGVSKESIRKILRRLFRELEGIQVTVTSLDVSIEGPTARVEFKTRVRMQVDGVGEFGGHGQQGELDLLQSVDGRWRIVRIRMRARSKGLI